MCCRGEWKEAKTKEVKLPEVEPQAFQIYLQWLYTKDLVTGFEPEVKPRLDSNKEEWFKGSDHFSSLIEQAILADKLQDTALENAVINATITTAPTMDLLPFLRPLSMLKDNIRNSSGFYRAVISLIACQKDTILDHQGSARHSPEVLLDVILHMMKERSATSKSLAPSLDNACERYHQHEDGEPRCSEPESDKQAKPPLRPAKRPAKLVRSRIISP